MRKIWLWVCVMILLSGILPAAANPIYIPPEEGDIVNDYIDVEIFMTAGENGWVTGWRSESDDMVISDPLIPIPNGTEVVVNWLACKYGTDDCWAFPISMRLPWEDEFERDNFQIYNFRFLSMEELVPAYDSVDFIEEHEEEILPFDEDFDFCALLPFAVWNYPDSLTKLKTIDNTFFPHDKCPSEPDYYIEYRAADRVYIDEEGVRWVTFEWDGNFGKGWVNIGPAAE